MSRRTCSTTLRLVKEGYQDFTTTFTVLPGDFRDFSTTLVAVTQTSTFGTIGVASTPTGAEVYIDGTYRGTHPGPERLVPDAGGPRGPAHRHRQDDRLQHVLDHRRCRSRARGRTSRPRSSQAQPAGAIQVTTNPAGATVTLDGLDPRPHPTPIRTSRPAPTRSWPPLTGTSRFCSLSRDVRGDGPGHAHPDHGPGHGRFAPRHVDPGGRGHLPRRRLSRTHPDHDREPGAREPQHPPPPRRVPGVHGARRRSSRARRPSSRSRSTALPPSVGSIDVVSYPAGASVFLDGAYRGQTSPYDALDIPNIAPGDHGLVLSLEGYYNYVTTVAVTAGQVDARGGDPHGQAGREPVRPAGRRLVPRRRLRLRRRRLPRRHARGPHARAHGRSDGPAPRERLPGLDDVGDGDQPARRPRSRPRSRRIATPTTTTVTTAATTAAPTTTTAAPTTTKSGLADGLALTGIALAGLLVLRSRR